MASSIWSAGRYDSVGERIERIAVELVDIVDRRVPVSGKAVVDLACGTGSAALAAAGRGAVVTGVDITPELLAIGAEKDTHDRITWLAADAADTGLPDGVHDAVVSNMGIIFVDPDRQLAELVRLLKPAGILGFSSWVRSASNPFFDPIVAVLGAPPSRAFTPDQWGDPAIVQSRLAPGFTDVEVDQRSFSWEFASLDAALHFLVHESPMHVDVFSRIDGCQHAELADAFRVALEPHSGAGGVSFDTPYVVVSASRRS
jgi:SAM-dependent methyltransferase